MAKRSVDPRSVGLVYQPYIEQTRVLAAQVEQFLAERHIGARTFSAFELQEGQGQGLDLAITLGGDGTVLRAARWLAPLRIPILPIGMGGLSFLRELSAATLLEHLEPYLEGDFWLDERAMLCAQAQGAKALALNDVVVGRGAASRAVKLDLWVDEAHVVRYVADGLVLATATGSTGYALAAGGPVLAPHLDDILVQPVAPHLAAFRALILPGSSRVRVRLQAEQPGALTLDGQVDHPFPPGQEVQVAVAQARTLFARRGQRSDFYRELTSRLVRAPA